MTRSIHPPQQPECHCQLKAHTLRSFIQPATAFDSPEGILTIKPETITFHVTDPSRVGWVDVSLTRAAFASFHTTFDSVAIRVDDLCDFVDLIPDSSMVELIIDQADGVGYLRAANISFRTALVVSRYVPTVYRETDPETIASVSVDPSTVSSAITLGEPLTELIRITGDSDRGEIEWTANGDKDTLRLRLQRSNTTNFELGDFAAAYPLSYLVRINQVIPRGVPLRIEHTKTGLMRLQYPIDDDQGAVTFTLKPSIRTPAG